jgi:hypothetical protein
VIYTSRGVIGPVYLLDAVIQVCLMAAWVVVLALDRKWRAKPSGDRPS